MGDAAPTTRLRVACEGGLHWRDMQKTGTQSHMTAVMILPAPMLHSCLVMHISLPALALLRNAAVLGVQADFSIQAGCSPGAM